MTTNWGEFFRRGVLGHSRVDASVMQMEPQAMLILSGRFIGFLPCHIAAPWVGAGAMRAVKASSLNFDSQHFVAYRRGADAKPIIAEFLRACLNKPG